MKSRPLRLILLLALALGWMLLGVPLGAREALAAAPDGAPTGVTGQDPAAAAGAVAPYSFGVVPQQSAARLAEMWVPLLQRLQALGGVPLKFETAKDIHALAAGLAQDRYDFAYMNPYHFVAFSAHPGYHALARDRQERLQVIMVVAKDSPLGSLEELAGQDSPFRRRGPLPPAC
ncbi:MAG: PhnD/SsuA/transferrin family substrate-binding protein [Chromatiaceae bacterium]